MRRFIILKHANTPLIPEKINFSEALERSEGRNESQRNKRSQTSFQIGDDSLMEGNSRTFYQSPQKLRLRAVKYSPLISNSRNSPLSQHFAHNHLRNFSKRSSVVTQRPLPQCQGTPANLCINGRPLTASSMKKEGIEQKIQAHFKKRDSAFSYGDSELVSRMDPKFFDEEYTNMEDYAQMLINQHTVKSKGVEGEKNTKNEREMGKGGEKGNKEKVRENDYIALAVASGLGSGIKKKSEAGWKRKGF
jgi:hypothetical protein